MIKNHNACSLFSKNDLAFRPMPQKNLRCFARTASCWQHDFSGVHCSRNIVRQRRMNAFFIVPLHKSFQADLQFRQRGKALSMHAFVLRCPPKSLNINVVQPPPATIPTVLCRTTIETTQKLRTRQLTPLIAVEKLRLAGLRQQTADGSRF